MRIVVENDKFINKLTSVDNVVKANAAEALMLSDLQAIQRSHEELKTIHNKMGQNGPLRWIARLPRGVWNAWVKDDPDIQWSKGKFWKMLDNHPEYCTYRRS